MAAVKQGTVRPPLRISIQANEVYVSADPEENSMAPSHHSKLQESSEKLQFLYHPAHHPKNPFLFATPCKFLNFLPQNRKNE